MRLLHQSQLVLLGLLIVVANTIGVGVPDETTVERTCKLGDMIRQRAEKYPKDEDDYRWFKELSEADKKSVIDELNGITAVVRDKLHRVDTRDGHKEWRFASDKEPTIKINGSGGPRGRTQDIQVKVRDWNLIPANGGPESKECHFIIEWRLRVDRGLPSKEGKKITGVNMPFGLSLLADPDAQAPVQPKEH